MGAAFPQVAPEPVSNFPGVSGLSPPGSSGPTETVRSGSARRSTGGPVGGPCTSAASEKRPSGAGVTGRPPVRWVGPELPVPPGPLDPVQDTSPDMVFPAAFMALPHPPGTRAWRWECTAARRRSGRAVPPNETAAARSCSVPVCALTPLRRPFGRCARTAPERSSDPPPGCGAHLVARPASVPGTSRRREPRGLRGSGRGRRPGRGCRR